MPENFSEWMQKLTPALVLAVLGGLVKLLQVGCRITLGRVVVSIMTAGFTGVVVFLLIQDLSMPQSLQAAIVGICGYSAGEILSVLSETVKKLSKKYSRRILDEEAKGASEVKDAE